MTTESGAASTDCTLELDFISRVNLGFIITTSARDNHRICMNLIITQYTSLVGTALVNAPTCPQ